MDQFLSLTFEESSAVEQVRARFRRAGKSQLMLGLQTLLIRRQSKEHAAPDMSLADERNAKRGLK